MITADHGEEFWEHGGVGHGHSLFGEVLNIPLIVRFPNGEWGGRGVGGPVSLLDVLPTLRDCVGLPREPRDEGRSLMPLVRDPHASVERTLYVQLYRPDATEKRLCDQKAVLHKRRKVVVGLPDGPRLFDLWTDPLDRVDLAKDEPRIVDDLQGLYVAFEHASRKTFSDESELHLDSDVVERLKALGYLQ